MIIWTYFLIPFIILLFIIIGLIINKGKFLDDLVIKEKKGEILNEYYLFENDNFRDDIYKNLKESLNETVFLVNNEEDQKLISDFIKEETDIIVNCYLEEEYIIEPYKNLIILNYENGKYKFNLIQNNIIEKSCDLVGSNYFTKHFFDLKSRDFEKSTDIFFIEDYKNNTYNVNPNYFMFLSIQSLLSKYLIIKEKKMNPDKNLKILVGNNLYPSFTNYKNSYNYEDASSICFSAIISFLFSIFTYFFNLEMIDEKEKKLDIFLKINGIDIIKYYFSWLLLYIILIILSFILCIIVDSLYCIFFFFIFFINIFLYILNLFLVSIFFYNYISSVKYGSVIIRFFNFISPLLGLVLTFLPNPRLICFIFSLIPQINVIFCTNTIFKLQTFSSLSNEKLWLKANKMSFYECIIMYIIGLIIYLILIMIKLYLKQLIKIFKNKKNSIINNINNDDKDNNKENLKLSEITKCYKCKNIINNLNLEIFPGEIFCILGANETGKTTLLNIISGILEADNGKVIYNASKYKSRKPKISLCQQEDIFFDYLTIQEYLEYISEIKNGKLLYDKINGLLNQLNLEKNKYNLCCTLSEGEKRKLSCALSLIIDDCKILLLDEPTRGIDIISKQRIWNLIKEEKKNKIIVIGTYSFDEAKQLSDKHRIGILDNGNLIIPKAEYIYLNFFQTQNQKNEIKNMSFDFQTPNPENDISIQLSNNFKNIIEFQKDKITKNKKSKKILSLKLSENYNNITDVNKLLNFLEENGIIDYSLKLISLKDILIKKNKEENLNLNFEIVTKSFNFYQKLKQQYILLKFLFLIDSDLILIIIELLYILVLTFVYIFYYTSFIINYFNKDLSLIKILEEHPIYIYEYQKDYLKASNVYSLSKSIKFIDIKENPETLYDFINLVHNISFANIAKGSIAIKNDNNILESYNTYIYSEYSGYLFANTMMIVSAFLKNEYNIEASIFPEIKQKNNYNYEKDIEKPTKFAIGLSIFACSFNYILILTGILYNVIKEKNSCNFKNLLYLKGINKLNYWLIYFIIYLLKIIYYSIILYSSIIHLNDIGKYILPIFLLISLSSIIFIYVISNFLPKKDRGTKFIFIIILIFAIITGFLIYFYYKLDESIYEHLKYLIKYKQYNFTYLDITPITSMFLSLARLFNSYLNNNKGMSLYIDCINQILNIIVYGFLLIILEFGIFDKFIHNLKVRIFDKKNTEEITENNYISPTLENIDGKSNGKIVYNSEETSVGVDEINGRKNNLVSNNKNIIIKIKNLTKIILDCYSNKKIIENYNLDVIENKNNFFCNDNNGSGKTIIFKSIINEIFYEKGSIFIFDKDNKNSKEFNKIKNRIGYCPQINYNSFNNMKVKEIIQFFIDFYSNSFDKETYCKIFGLDNHLDIKFINLSYSNKRKLMLAISLINKPNLLLLDNPLNGVDIISRKKIWNNLKKIFKNKCTSLLSTNLQWEKEIIDAKNEIKKFNSIEKSQDINTTKLYIIFEESLINPSETISDEDLSKLKEIVTDIDKFSNYFSNPKIKSCLKILFTFFNDNIFMINYLQIKDINHYFFIFDIGIITSQKKHFFVKILNMKAENSAISKIKIH